MPKKNQTARAARKARKDLLSRTNKKKQGRKGRRRPGPHAPAVIANSLFALTLNSVPGVVVECNKTLQAGAPKLYSDLLLCYKQLVSSPGAAPKLPADDLPIEQKVSVLMKLIRRSLHQGGFNIEQIDGHFCIIIYYKCDYVNYLPCMQIGNALVMAKKEHPRVHDLFVSFLKTFLTVTCVDTWFDSNFEYSLTGLEDSLHQLQHDQCRGYTDDIDPEWVEEAKKDLELYQKGLPKQYEKLLRRSKRIKSVEDILKALNRFNTKHPLLRIIKRGCSVIDPRCSMYKYGYNPDKDTEDDEDDGYYSLEFVNQAIIHWKFDGPVIDEFDQWIDSQANEGGVKEPICKFIIHPKSKEKFNEEELKQICAWPPKLADFFAFANGILNKYGKK